MSFAPRYVTSAAVADPLVPVRTIRRSEALLLLGLAALALLVSGIAPYDRTTWLLEVFPILIAAPILVATARRFPLTPLVYRLIFLHALILMLGGAYTYARVPLGFWIQDAFGLARNHYDRLGHFAQGFVPAMIAREILLRRTPLRRGGWLFVIVTSICLAISACYEFVEWWAALLGGSAANEFLGTQGDVWDTQWDMFMALLGAITAQLSLGRIHDRSLRQNGVRVV
jgi:putative membrane protein